MNNTYNTWFDIKGFEGLYQINQNGEIRSLYNYRKYKNYSHAGGYIWKYKSEVMSNANGS